MNGVVQHTIYDASGRYKGFGHLQQVCGAVRGAFPTDGCESWDCIAREKEAGVCLCLCALLCGRVCARREGGRKGMPLFACPCMGIFGYACILKILCV